MKRICHARKNILILVTTAIGGGVERLIFDQMRYYDRLRFNLHVVTLRKGYLEREFSSTDANYFCLNSTKRISYNALRKLVDYIIRHRIDLIHTHLYLCDIYGWLAKISIPRVKLMSTKHNTNDFRKKIYWGLFDNFISLPASQIIAVSESVKKFITRYEFIPGKRMKVLYHGVDVKRFRRGKPNDKLRQNLGIKKTDFVIGIVGRINRQKGHTYLLEAVALLKSKIRNIRLLIVGKGDLQEPLEKYSAKLGIGDRVHFLGYRPDVADLYPLMNILCLPSIFEGLGLVIVEAMLCGTLTVAARVDGITEIIEDGVNGFLFPPRDSTALAEVILKIYKSRPDSKMIERARKDALRFDFRKNIKNIEKLYIEVLS